MLQAHVLGLISSPSQPLPTATPTTSTSAAGGVGSSTVQGHGEGDLRRKLDHKKILVVNVEDRDKVTEYFEVRGTAVTECKVSPACCCMSFLYTGFV